MGYRSIFFIMIGILFSYTAFAIVGTGQTYKHYDNLISSAGFFSSDSYQTNIFFGSAGYSYDIDIPQGIDSLQPSVSLSYSHHAAKMGVAGFGWGLSEAIIYRDTNFTRSNRSDDGFRINLKGLDEELVYLSPRYHTLHESYMSIEKKTGSPNTFGEYWIARTKDGMKYRFGYNNDSELVSNIETYAVSWRLDQVEDTHNNLITYSYKEEPSKAAAYLANITYGANSIIFLYNFSAVQEIPVYSTGCEIRQTGLLKEIQVFRNSNLLRKYLFSYSDLGHITGSFLTSIQEAGADGTTKLPATTFGYNTPSAGWEDDAAWQLPQGANFGKDGWKDNGVRLVDINFDGLTDILRMYNSSDLELWINNGEGWEQKKTIGSFFAGGFVGSDGLDKGVRFFDLDSDLRLDIIKAEAGERVVKINRGGNEGWQWNTSNISFPQEADFIKTTGRIIQYIDCNPGGCPSGYSDIGYICDGDYCNITCSNRQCAGSEPQLIWQDTETDSGYGGWCEAKTDYFYYCGSSGGDCIQPQPVCFVLQHLGGGGGADSSVRSQAYEMSCGGSGYDGCTDEFDGSWEWRYEKIMYCVPNFLSCGGDSSCRNDCWKPGAKSWTYWELDPSPNEDCTDSVTFQANEQCGAGLYVYTVPVEGEEIVKSCERQKVYQLPMDQGVNVFDVNGDGHSDIVKSTALEKKTWTSDGKRWSLSPEWQMPEDFVDENGTDKGVRIADLNGDGLPDILKANGTATKSWLNSGKGWIPNDIWTVPTEAMFLSGGNDTGVRIEDINADGLFDLIKNNGSSSKTWLNNGAGWSLVNEWALPAFASTINSLVRLADIDGDGSLDIIKEDGVLINKATYPFLRVSNNSHGGTTTINYTKISNFDNDGDDGISDFGFAGWVVQSISQDSGMAGRWKAVTLIKYNYTGAYYSSSEREYRGFGKVTEKLADVEIEHYYHQDDGRASLEYKTDTFDLQGNPFKSVVYNWQSKEKQGCYVTTLDDITEYTYDGLSWD